MKKNRIILFLVLFFFCISIAGCTKKAMVKKAEFTFFSCGKADITLIESENYHVLIDTGDVSCQESVIKKLKDKKVPAIDLMILTHPDKDHIGNAVAIMKEWKVDKILETNYLKHSSIENELHQYIKDNQIQTEIVTDKKEFQYGDMKIEIEGPQGEFDSSNNSSLITWITIQDVTAFMGADIKEKRIEELLLENNKKASLVKLPYHGKDTSNIKELLLQLQPEWVVITNQRLENKMETLLKRLQLQYVLTTQDIVLITDGYHFERKR